MSEKPVLLSLPLSQPTQAQANLAQAERDLPAMCEFQKLAAKLYRARFEALISEGFTKTQAIELCKTVIG